MRTGRDDESATWASLAVPAACCGAPLLVLAVVVLASAGIGVVGWLLIGFVVATAAAAVVAYRR